MGHRQVRIQSDGDPKNTVVTLEDGTQLYPSEATIYMDAREASRTDLTFVLPLTDIHTNLDETTLECPVCQHSSTHYCPGVGK